MANSGNLANLRPFRMGQFGNPGGRPKGTSLLAALRAELEKPDGADPHALTNREQIAAWVVRLSLAGDARMIRLVCEYVEGKPVQPVDLDIHHTAPRRVMERGLDLDKVISLYEVLKAKRSGVGHIAQAPGLTLQGLTEDGRRTPSHRRD